MIIVPITQYLDVDVLQVMLRNVHLAPRWLSTLEKKLHSMVPHENFRLFLTSEISPKLPLELVRQSHVYVFEQPAGVKASILHSFSLIPAARMDEAPRQRSRLYFLLAWLHAIVQVCDLQYLIYSNNLWIS